MRFLSFLLFFIIFIFFIVESNSFKLTSSNVKISNSNVRKLSYNLNTISIYSYKASHNFNKQLNMVNNNNNVPKEKVETKYVVALM